MISLDRSVLSDLDALTAREWLVTNGIGGYACGTVSGVATRRYHGLLVAALSPPRSRHTLISHVDERVVLGAHATPLSTRAFADVVTPDGWRRIEGFSLDLVGSNGIGALYAGPDYAARTWQAASKFTEEGGVGIFTRPATEMKCAGAPLKHTFLIDDIARRRGNRARML